MVKGLQVGFGEPVGAPLMAALAQRSVWMVRLDMQPVTLAETFRAICQETIDAGLRPLLIIRPDQVETMLALPEAFGPLDLEVQNEPDLRGASPGDYVASAWRILDALRGRHRIWAGCVSNLHRKGQDWLAAVVRGLPLDVGITVHRYPRNGQRPDGKILSTTMSFFS